MNFKTTTETLKYFDFFGEIFSFYIEKNRKLYTPLGGIMTLLFFIFSTIIFIYMNLDDFLHNLPNSTTSREKEVIRKIKFKDEKIWIPWRIRDFGGKTVNHTDFIFPIIYYYKGIKDKELKKMVTSYELINYKLCSETSMANYTELFNIDIQLDQLYCIDMEDLDISGSWYSDFIFLISFNIYACKNGIDYDENNENCTTYDQIAEFTGINNCLVFEMYYPVVYYQPMNKNTPIFIEYENYFYYLSRFSNKIDRLYLQQHVLEDDRGWIAKNEKMYSRWGCTSLNGESYAIGNKRDLMNQGSTSRFYSFNIYLKPGIIYYKRSYKKLYLIIADGLPIINIVFIFFGLIAKIFKISSHNQKLAELLFENLKEKKSFMILSPKKNDNTKFRKGNTPINKNNLSINKDDNNFSSIHLAYQENYNEPSSNQNQKNQITNKNIGKDENKFYNSSSFINSLNNNNNMNQNVNIFTNKKNDLSSNFSFKKKKHRKTYDLMDFSLKSRTHYIKKQLFPFKYYLCSIFIKNIDISKGSYFFTHKFIAVYTFICQLFDISSYLILQKEFQTMKNTILEEKERKIIESGEKINISNSSFNIQMKECLEKNKFLIFGKLKQTKSLGV